MYSPKVLQHFKKPHNYGKIANADGIGKVGNIVCGDVMWLYLKIAINSQGQEIIKNIKFETFGCVSAIATSSYITDLAKGKTLADALHLTKDNIISGLGGLPPIKIHCSVLAIDALTEAIYDHYSKTNQPLSDSLKKDHDRIVKSREIVENRYHDWVQKEETLHQSE